MWTLMMTAMMLPSAAPFAATYARTFYTRRQLRMLAFSGGYLLVWGLSAVPAFGVAWVAGEAAERSGAVATVFAVGVFGACGIYQLTPLKYRCLSHCRTPLGHLFHVASFQGPFRDLRVGIEHGYFCLACCWSLMLLMAAFGIMNLAAMVVLAAVIATEKLWSRGELFARATGVVALSLAVLVIWIPELAPGLSRSVMSAMGGG
jgi:predicted metal-binding membrane protein